MVRNLVSLIRTRLAGMNSNNEVSLSIVSKSYTNVYKGLTINNLKEITDLR